MWTTTFWIRTGERAIKTAAQTAVSLLTGDGLGVLDVDWADIGSVSLLAAIASVLTCIASIPLGEDHTSPSAVK
jgi:hypothetical protein